MGIGFVRRRLESRLEVEDRVGIAFLEAFLVFKDSFTGTL